MDYAAADVQYRPGRFAHLLHGELDLFRIAHGAGLIAWHPRRSGIVEWRHLSADILGNVDEDWSWPPGRRNIKSFLHDTSEVFCISYQVVVFRAGPRYSNGVYFLERVAPDHLSWNLAGDYYERRRVPKGVGDAGDRVSYSGT